MVLVISTEPDGLARDPWYAGVGAAFMSLEVLVLDSSGNGRLSRPGGEPFFEVGFPGSGDLRKLFLCAGDLFSGIRDLLLVGLRRVQEGRGWYRAREIGVETELVDVVEEGEELVILALGQGIVFVIVAARAFKSQPEERGGECVGPVSDVFNPEFFGRAAALDLLGMETVEGRGEDLFVSCPREQVSCQLELEEAIVGDTLIEGIHHPVPPRPHESVPVHLVAVGVRVAGDIEPVRGHPLAIGG